MAGRDAGSWREELNPAERVGGIPRRGSGRGLGGIMCLPGMAAPDAKLSTRSARSARLTCTYDSMHSGTLSPGSPCTSVSGAVLFFSMQNALQAGGKTVAAALERAVLFFSMQNALQRLRQRRRQRHERGAAA